MEEQEEKGKRAAPGALYVQGSSQSMGARDWEGLRALVPAGACLMMIGKWAGLGCGALGSRHSRECDFFNALHIKMSANL